jgi:hypothetical protein
MARLELRLLGTFRATLAPICSRCVFVTYNLLGIG